MSASSNSDFAVETVKELLEDEPTGTWTYETPDIYKVQDTTQSFREQYADPAFYLWSPVDTDFVEFDAEGSSFDQTDTVEVWIHTLDETKTARYVEDVVGIMDDYMRDNHKNTNFHQIKPISAADNRHEHITRKTDHYPANVQIELSVLRQT